ncbi:transposable element Tcb1 transposase [Trichonephila clavipes]|nr:transposable element Tcb1 transposase [Trichonephila clavipes]
MDWPAYSPDLNPIEHVWDALGRRIAARLHHPENTQQLKQMLIEEWVLLPQEMLHQLVLSMRRRSTRVYTSKPRLSRPSKLTIREKRSRKLVCRKPCTTLQKENLVPTVKPRGGGHRVGVHGSNGVGKLEYIESIMNKYDYFDVLKSNLKETLPNSA